MDKEKSIKLLNDAVASELQSIDQYLYFHFHCEDRGYDPLAKIFHRISIAEMKHVEMLAERILFLKGDVEMKRRASTQKITEVEKMLECARKLEETTVEEYNRYAKMASENDDSATKTLFEKLVVEEEGHEDVYDTEVDNLETFGDSYLALQSIDRSKESGIKNPKTE